MFPLSLVAAASLLASTAAASPLKPAPAAHVGLNALAQRHGKYIGTATEAYNIRNDTAWGHEYGETALSNEFGAYTDENFLKWETTEPQPGVFNFTPADALFRIAERNGKKMRGHTLGTPFVARRLDC